MAKQSTTPTNSVRVTKIRDIIKKKLEDNFSATLGRETDIVNIVNALIMHESTYNVNAIGKDVGSAPRTGGGNYLQSSAISAKLNNPSTTPTERANILNGLKAVGVMQVMGYYFVRGGAPSGLSELERSRPDLAGPLMVNPGEDVFTNILGESNLDKAITAGLIILESKYRSVSIGNGYFYIKGDPYSRKFNSKIQGAITAYLGLGKQDANGTTPENYARRILGGDIYASANGKGSLKIRDSDLQVASTNGPDTDGSSLNKLKIAGC